MATTQPLGPRFARLWSAAAISNFGDGLVIVALPLLVESLTTNALYVSGLVAMRFSAWLLLGLIGGVVADRADRQRVMVYVDLARTVAVGLLGVVTVLGTPPIALIWLTAFLLGCGETFFDTASEAMLPAVVDEEHLERANSRLFATQTIANELVGPPIGALLFGVAAALPMLLDAWSFLAAAMIVLSLRGSFGNQHASGGDLIENREAESPDAPPPPTVRGDIREGFAFVAQHRLLRSIVALGCVWNFFAVGAESTLVLFARRELHISASAYGLVLAGFAIGGVLAAWKTEAIAERFGPGTTIVATFALGSVAGLSAAFTHNTAVFVVAFACNFAAGTAASIVVMTLRQRLVPDALRGRVSSFFRVSVFAAGGTGAVAMGIVAQHVSYRAPLIALGCAGAVLFAVATSEVTNANVDAALADGASGPAASAAATHSSVNESSASE